MATELDNQVAALKEALAKAGKFTAEDLQKLRMGSPAAGYMTGRTGDAFMVRMEVELIDAIRVLDETSTRLVTTTNRLTTVILVLTGVGIFIAAIGVLIALVQLFNK
jgi:hypothetical protein